MRNTINISNNKIKICDIVSTPNIIYGLISTSNTVFLVSFMFSLKSAQKFCTNSKYQKETLNNVLSTIENTSNIFKNVRKQV